MSTHLEKHCGRFPNPQIVGGQWLVYRCPACGLEGSRSAMSSGAANSWNDLVAPGWRERLAELERGRRRERKLAKLDEL